MKFNQLKLGSLLAYVQMGLNILVGILYTPVMLRLLGQSEYGLYSTVSSTIVMLSILSLGFNSSYLRFFSGYKLRMDEASISKLNGLFIIVFTIIGLIALCCGLFLSTHLELIFDDGLTSDELAVAESLMIVLTINLAISFPMSVFQNIISAHERYVFLKLIGMLKTVMGPLITLPLLLMGYRSIAVVVATLIISIITDVIYFVYAKTYLHIKFVFRGFDREIFKQLFSYTIFIALNLIVDQINNNLDKFLLGRYKGALVVAVYSLGNYLYSYYVMFSTAVSGVFSPRIHRIVNETINDKGRQRVEVTKLFIKVGRVQFLIMGLVVSGFVFFGKTFIYYWAGDGYEESYYVALLMMLSAFVPLIQNTGIEIQRAMNKHRFRSIAYSLMAIINIVLTIFLCQRYGAVGAAIGTAISLVIMNGFIINIYYHWKCNIDMVAFWKEICHLASGLIVPIMFGVFVDGLTDTSSFYGMLVGIIIYAVVYGVSMWHFGMNEFEKDLLRIPLSALRNWSV